MDNTLNMLRGLYERADHPCTRIAPADLRPSDVPLDIKATHMVISAHVSAPEADSYLLGRVQEMKRLRSVMLMGIAETLVWNVLDDSDHTRSNYCLLYTHALTGAVVWGRYGGYELSGLAVLADTPDRRERAAAALLRTDITEEDLTFNPTPPKEDK